MIIGYGIMFSYLSIELEGNQIIKISNIKKITYFFF
jgi:hypothetical protein